MQRMGVVIGALTFALGCGDDLRPENAGGDADVGISHFCDGLPKVNSAVGLTAPYVTFSEQLGTTCVLTQGGGDGTPCGMPGSAGGSIEDGCPWTSIAFDMDDRPRFTRQLFVQSRVASMTVRRESPRSGRVVGMVIDQRNGNLMTGRYRVEFPSAGQGRPAVHASGAFQLCIVPAVPFDPCRER